MLLLIFFFCIGLCFTNNILSTLLSPIQIFLSHLISLTSTQIFFSLSKTWFTNQINFITLLLIIIITTTTKLIKMFTCNTCNLQFPAAEDQRSHMKSEWHRYNLKRRVAQLPPITEDLFNSKVSTLTNTEETKQKQLTKRRTKEGKKKEAILEQKTNIRTS